MKQAFIISVILSAASGLFFLYSLLRMSIAFATGVGAFFIVCVCLSVLLYRQMKISAFMTDQLRQKKSVSSDALQEEIHQLQLSLRNAEYSSLQSQINPHFLYNTLDSIRSKALTEGQHEIADMAERLAVFFRYCISNREHLVRIREELSHINDYYLIQKFRFGDRFDMTVSCENEEIYDYYIPKMTLQPIVENALHHGIEKSTKKGMIAIRIIAFGERIEITVSDNGAGMSVEQVKALNEKMNQTSLLNEKKRNGIAVSNISARIRLIFGEDYGIRYRSAQNIGTDVIVTIPAVDDFQRVRYENRDTQV